MHLQYLHDQDRDLDPRRLDVVDHPQLHHLHQVHLVIDMDQKMLLLHQYVVGNYLFRFRHLLVVVHQDVLQNLDAQNLDALPPFLDEVHLVAVLVDVELRHLLKMDCFQDVVGAELRHLQRKDYFQDVALLELKALLGLKAWLIQLLQPLLHPVQPFQHRVMPSELQDQRRVQLLTLLRVLDLLRQSSLRLLSF
jgi:hypothetical protein